MKMSKIGKKRIYKYLAISGNIKKRKEKSEMNKKSIIIKKGLDLMKKGKNIFTNF